MSRERFDSSRQNDWSKWVYARGKETGSHCTYYMSDIDSLFYDPNNGEVLIIETKEYQASPSEYQRLLLEMEYRVHTASLDRLFRGCHLIQFQCTSPDNGFTNIKSFNGERWVCLKEEITSSVQFKQWFANLKL